MINKIEKFLTSNYTEQRINNILDECILEYLDDDWEEIFKTEYDWYTNFCNGEAEEELFDILIEACCNHIGITKYHVVFQTDGFLHLLEELYPIINW